MTIKLLIKSEIIVKITSLQIQVEPNYSFFNPIPNAHASPVASIELLCIDGRNHITSYAIRGRSS